MISTLLNFLLNSRDRQRIAVALGKGAAMMQARRIDLKDPGTWEFSAFSQNGEDGIIDVLRSQMSNANRYFVEIGSADGIQNNTAWLLIAENCNGLLIEGNPKLVARAERTVVVHSIGSECKNMFVTRDNVGDIKALALHEDPDVFSLDIDGNDYYIAQALMECGFRPKIFVVEFNSVFGPERSMTVEYNDNFVFTRMHSSHLYYGVSIAGWRTFFERHGYRFVTVDRNGVNAFFVDPQHFELGFLDQVCGLPFAENMAQYKKFGQPFDKQFELISGEKFVAI